MSEPYPDEQAWWPAFEARVAALYGEAGQAFPDNPAAFRWHGRTAYDIGAGVPAETSAGRHLRECADALGVPSPAPVIVRPTRLRIEGTRFVTADGQPWIWKGATDFLLYKRWLEGEDITPLLRERREAGANLLRVFMQCHNIAHFYPADYDGYYERISVFSESLASQGFWWEAVAYCDEQNVKSGPSHWTLLTDQLKRCDNAVAELVNEHKQNGVDPSRFAHPGGGLLCSRGSGLSDEPPFRPGWDFYGWHGRRDWPKVTSSTEDMWYIANCKADGWHSDNPAFQPPRPIVHDEPMGFAANAEPNRRSNDPNLARLLGAAAVTLGAGGTYHSENGIYSRPWDDTEKSCARAFLGAM
jgi:hypothetical protein